ncbi:hypothetical protein BST96_02570 [Oceanicoccus sagamiensis]|uniref:Uncharacterized protein n=1 Tax=Oceanicoccus sagamiensis TaxID=716816 RepID=A0A1X9NDQ5_9GAMM|nr:hypothetical protein BST96_02570 [Oceanicoccus sagamiensis]
MGHAASLPCTQSTPFGHGAGSALGKIHPCIFTVPEPPTQHSSCITFTLFTTRHYWVSRLFVFNNTERMRDLKVVSCLFLVAYKSREDDYEMLEPSTKNRQLTAGWLVETKFKFMS